MIHKLVDAIRDMGDASQFETYCWDLQREGLAGVPTADEARKDYSASLLSRARVVTY